MSKQQQQISIALAWLNGGTATAIEGQSLRDRFTLFKGFPNAYSIWNINYNAEREFIGAPTKRALSGVERAGISGYRLNIDLSLTNTTTSQTNAIRALLDVSSSQYIRRPGWEFGLDNFNFSQRRAEATGGDSSGYPFTVSGSLANAYLYNKTKNQLRLIRTYAASTKGLLFDADISTWETTDDYELKLLNNQPTIWAVGYDTSVSLAQTSEQESWSGGYIFCNLVSSSIAINRELTIGTQAINLQFRSVERFRGIPTKQVL